VSVAALITKVRNLRSESITLRRGSGTVTAQTMRVERTSKGRLFDSDRGSERRADVVINAAVGANIALGDRFTSGGILYEVTFIRPNKSVATFAEAVAIE